MKTINAGAIYVNKRNNRQVKVLEWNEKFKTCIIEFQDDNSNQNITFSTFNRWYKEDDSIVSKESIVSKDVPVEESKVEEVIEEQTASVQIAGRDAVLEDLFKYFQDIPGSDVRIWKPYSVAVKFNGKPVLEFRVLKNGSITLYTKESFLPESFEYNKINNYYLPYVIKGLDTNTIKNIKGGN